MYEYARVKRADGSSMYRATVIYFVSVMAIGNIVLLALFTAILLRKFNDDYQDQLKKKEEEKK